MVQSKNKLQWRFSQAERNAHRPNHVHIPTISKLERGGRGSSMFFLVCKSSVKEIHSIELIEPRVRACAHRLQYRLFVRWLHAYPRYIPIPTPHTKKCTRRGEKERNPSSSFYNVTKSSSSKCRGCVLGVLPYSQAHAYIAFGPPREHPRGMELLG